MLNGFWAITQSELDEIKRYDNALKNQGMVEVNNNKIEDYGDGFGLIQICGPLYSLRTNLTKYTGGAVYSEISTEITRLLHEKDVKKIVLRINSPGGSIIGCGELASVIHAAKEIKPIISLVEGQACSGAIWIASASSQILLSSFTARVGSVGVILQRTEQTPEDGIVATGELKSAASRKTSKKRREYLSDIRNQLFTAMLTDISYYRELSDAQVKSISTGAVFIGDKAIQVGLSDAYFSPFIWLYSRKIHIINHKEVQK